MVISQYSTEQCSVSSSAYEKNVGDVDERIHQDSPSRDVQPVARSDESNENTIKSSAEIDNDPNADSPVTTQTSSNIDGIGAPSTGCKSQSGPPSLSISNDDLERRNSSVNCENTVSNSLGSDSKIEKTFEENYEGIGYGRVDVDVDVESPGDDGSSSAPSPTNGLQPFGKLNSAISPSSTLGRHTWLRTSLRRAPSSATSGRSARPLGSNALASQLYRSGSFNSSGRGSTCDATDDMYSDVSLEDDVIDLNHRVRMIQEQMDALVDTQSIGGERYARVKEENATLQARILMLEEAAKDAEARAEERLQAEQRRHRDWLSRLEREKQLQLENYAIKMQTLEVEASSLREQMMRIREQLDAEKKERTRLENSLDEANSATRSAQEAERQTVLRSNEMRILLDAAKDELTSRSRDRQRIEDLLLEVTRLTAKNKSLEESRDELQAAAALHAGRELLLMNPVGSYGGYDNSPISLAAELSADGNIDELDARGNIDSKPPRSTAELTKALKEQQDVNAQLHQYIDNILLNIVENYPHLLEVKQPNC